MTYAVIENELIDNMWCYCSIRAQSQGLRSRFSMVKIAVRRLEMAATTLNSARWCIAVPSKQAHSPRQNIIEPSAVRVQRCWIRISGGKCCGSSGTVGTVATCRLGKRIQQRLDCRRRTLARVQRWDVAVCNLRLPYSQAFVGAEEEQLVFYDRAAEYSTEVVLPQRRLFQAFVIGEPVVGIQNIIAEIFERGAMKRVRARFGHYRDLSSGSAPKLRSEGRSLNAKFLQCIERNQVAETAKCVRCRKLTGPALTKTGNGRTQIRAHPIHGEVIRVRSLSVHTKLAFFEEIAVYQHNSRREVDQSAEAAAV